MAKARIKQYLEVITSTGRKQAGKEFSFYDIELTGDGKCDIKEYNDISSYGSPVPIFYASTDGPITPGNALFVAVLASKDGFLGIDDNLVNANTSIIPVKAGVWTYIGGGLIKTETGIGTSWNRLTESDVQWNTMYYMCATDELADITVVGVQ